MRTLILIIFAVMIVGTCKAQDLPDPIFTIATMEVNGDDWTVVFLGEDYGEPFDPGAINIELTRIQLFEDRLLVGDVTYTPMDDVEWILSLINQLRDLHEAGKPVELIYINEEIKTQG